VTLLTRNTHLLLPVWRGPRRLVAAQTGFLRGREITWIVDDAPQRACPNPRLTELSSAFALGRRAVALVAAPQCGLGDSGFPSTALSSFGSLE